MSNTRVGIIAHRTIINEDQAYTRHVISYEFTKDHLDTFQQTIDDACMVLEEWVVQLLSRFVHLSDGKTFDDGVERISGIVRSYLHAYFFHDSKPVVKFKSNDEYPELELVARHKERFPTANVFCLQISIMEDETGVISNNTRIQTLFLNRFTTTGNIEMSIVVNPTVTNS